jgi:hypothetical protein
MMKALHNVNTMKREQLYLEKVNIHLFIYMVIIRSVTSQLHAICISGRNGSCLSKTKWAREPCSHTVGHIRGYKISRYLLA